MQQESLRTIFSTWRAHVAQLRVAKLFLTKKSEHGRAELLTICFKTWQILFWRSTRRLERFTATLRTRQRAAQCTRTAVGKWRLVRLRRSVQRNAMARVAKRRRRKLCSSALRCMEAAAHESASDVAMQRTLQRWMMRGSSQLMAFTFSRWTAFTASTALARTRLATLGNGIRRLIVVRELREAIRGTHSQGRAEASWLHLASSLSLSAAKRELSNVVQRSHSIERGRLIGASRVLELKKSLLRRWMKVAAPRAKCRKFRNVLEKAGAARMKLYVLDVWLENAHTTRTLRRLKHMLVNAFTFNLWAANVRNILHQRAVMKRTRDLLWPDVEAHLKTHMFALWCEHHSSHRARSQLRHVMENRAMRRSVATWRRRVDGHSACVLIAGLQYRRALRAAMVSWTQGAQFHGAREDVLARVCTNAHKRVLSRSFALLQGGVANHRAFSAGQATVRRLMLRIMRAKLRVPFAALARLHRIRAHLPRMERIVAAKRLLSLKRATFQAWHVAASHVVHAKGICGRVIRAMTDTRMRKMHGAWNAWHQHIDTMKLIDGHRNERAAASQAAVETAAAIVNRTASRRTKTSLFARWVAFVDGCHLQRRVINRCLAAHEASGAIRAFRTLVEHSETHTRHEHLCRRLNAVRLKRQARTTRRTFEAWLRVLKDKAFLVRVCGRAIRACLDVRSRMLSKGWTAWSHAYRMSKLFEDHADAAAASAAARVDRAAQLMMRGRDRRSKQHFLSGWMDHVTGRNLQRKIMKRCLKQYQFGGVAIAFRSMTEHATRARVHEDQLFAFGAALTSHNRRCTKSALSTWRASVRAHGRRASLIRRVNNHISEGETRVLRNIWRTWLRLHEHTRIVQQHQQATASLLMKGWNRRRKSDMLRRWVGWVDARHAQKEVRESVSKMHARKVMKGRRMGFIFHVLLYH